MGPEAERTPPVRRPARRDARGLGAEVVAMVVGLDLVEWGEGEGWKENGRCDEVVANG